MRPSLKRTLLALLGSASLACPALALDMPQPAGPDPHVRTVRYSESDVTLLVGTVNSPTTITFGDDEQVKTVAFGQEDAQPWRGPVCKQQKCPAPRNNLILWPVTPGRNTMQVVTVRTTDKGTEERVYPFVLIALPPPASCADLNDLLADPECQDQHSVSELRFTYAPDQAKQRQLAEERAAAEYRVRLERAAAARLATDYFYGPHNWKYVASENAAWRASGQPAPSVSDNGQQTVFRFPGYSVLPAIFTTSGARCGASHNDDQEQTAETIPTGINGLVVYRGVAAHFCLREGPAVMDIWNKAYDPIGHDPGTGTTSPDVVREVVRK